MVNGAAKMMTQILACSTQRSCTGRHRASGFTLLEIMLVLAILAMASILVVPNLGSLETRTFNAQVRQALSLLNYARRTAVVQGQPSSAIFYNGSIDREAIPAARANSGNWQAGASTSIRFRDSTDQEIEIEDLLEINFYPEGGSTGGTLLLQQDEQIVAIDIDPFTGRVTTAETVE